MELGKLDDRDIKGMSLLHIEHLIELTMSGRCGMVWLGQTTPGVALWVVTCHSTIG